MENKDKVLLYHATSYTTIHSNDLPHLFENTTSINIDIEAITLNPEVSQNFSFSDSVVELAPPCFPAN